MARLDVSSPPEPLHRTTRTRATWRRVALVWFCLLAGLPGGLDRAAFAQTSSELTGVLTVVWPDGQPAQPESPAANRPVFTLHTLDGQVWQIEVAAGSPRPDFRLAGRRVTATVATTARAAAAPAGLAAPTTGTAWVTSVQRVVPQGAIEAAAAQAMEVEASVGGSQPWVSIACKFSDVATEPKTLSYFTNMYGSVFPGLDHYWQELSYGQINVQGSSAHGWYTLPRTRAYYLALGGSMLRTLATDCTALAESDIDFAPVKGINLMFNADLDGYAWGGSSLLTLDGVYKSWRTTWEPPWGYGDVSVIEHEMGHGFGWPHSSGTYGAVYDNSWDVMSDSWYNCSVSNPLWDHPTYGCTGQQTIAYHKDLTGWLPTARKLTLPRGSAPTTVTIEPIAGLPAGSLSGLSAGTYLVAILQTGEASGRYFTVEVRKRAGYDAKLYGDGVIVHEVVPNRDTDDQPAHVMDASANSITADAGALWIVGETFSDAASSVSIRVDAATATGYVVTLSSGGVASTITSIAPSSGPTTGGTTLTIDGSGFVAGAMTVTVGGTAATAVNVSSGTRLTAVTPSHAAGTVDVSVNGASSTGAFTYTAVPTVTTLSPASGPAAGGTTLTINGTGFVAGATTVSIGGTAATSVSVAGSTRLTAVTPSHAAGTVTVSVTVAGGTGSASNAFTYLALPTVSGVAPATVSTAGGTSVTIYGTGFVAGSTTVALGGTAATSVNVVSSLQLTAVAPAHSAGAVSTIVTTAGGTATFTGPTYVQPTPTVTSISPSSGPAYSSSSVTIGGTNFGAGTTVTFGGTAATGVSLSGTTSLTCMVPPLGPGVVTVVVANGSATATTTFSYVAAPAITSVAPSTGPTSGGSSLSVSGTGFVAGATTVSVGGTAATSVNVLSATLLTVVSPPHVAGAVPVSVTTAGGATSLASAFTYVGATPAPTLAAVAPVSGSTTGGTTITLTGTTFVAGATTVLVGGAAATSVSVLSSSLLTAVTPPHAAGAVTVSVTTDGGTATFGNAFTYVGTVAAPTVTDVSPAGGPPEGGTRITVTGANFVADQTGVTVFGLPATNVVVESPTRLSATTPAGPDGSYVNVVVTNPTGSGSKLSAFWYGRVPNITTAVPNRSDASQPWQVTLTGDGFYDGVLQVSFGIDAALDVRVIDRWHVLASAPADMTGPRTATVTTPAGTATATVEFPGNSVAYLAEGATGSFFDLDIAIANPQAVPVPASVTFLKRDGSMIHQTYQLGPLSRVTIAADAVPGLNVGQVDVSTVVESPKPLVVERTMFWDQQTSYAGHGGSAVTGASRKWYFAEGFQGFFDTYLLLANATSSTASVTLTFLRESEPPLVTTVSVGKNARQTVWTGQFAGLANRGFATVIDSDVPIIAERAMYFGALPFWKGGHESAGVPAPAQEWSLAEGATGSYFDTYLLVANPNDSATAVTFRFLLGGEFEGQTYSKTVQLAPNSRYTLNPESLVDTDGFTDLADAAVSTFVSATQPIVVERAMYWPGGADTWTEAHNSFGVTETGTRWGLSEGRVGGSRRFQTYVLLANATDTDAVVRLTFMREAGSAIVQTVGVRAHSRYNVYVNGHVPGLLDGERFGVLVESQATAGAPGGVPISVERAMYWDTPTEGWAGGTNATAVRLP